MRNTNRQRRYQPTKRHYRHSSEVRQGKGPHYAALWCIECGKFVKWLTRAEAQAAGYHANVN